MNTCGKEPVIMAEEEQEVKGPAVQAKKGKKVAFTPPFFPFSFQPLIMKETFKSHAVFYRKRKKSRWPVSLVCCCVAVLRHFVQLGNVTAHLSFNIYTLHIFIFLFLNFYSILVLCLASFEACCN